MKLLGPGCGLDTDAMCRRYEIVVWLGCRIGGNGSDWKLGLRSTHRLRGGPRMHVLADLLGFRREKRSIFNVSSTCGRNSSHSWRGQCVSTVASAAMKCSLKVVMARSAALTRWLCGGTRWMLIFSDLMYFSTAAEHSLSITFSVGW